jgi:hypothetical protein
MSRKEKLIQWVVSANLWLKKALGEDKDLLFHFVRFLLIAILLALLVGVVVWIVAGVFQVVSSVVGVILASLPYLAAIAAVAGIVALALYAYRAKESKRTGEAVRRSDLQGQNSRQNQAQRRPPEAGDGLRQSLLAADQGTRSKLEAVLACLQRFDHRLQASITPAHYTDLFGDTWVSVREFVESSQGRSVPEVSAMLVEIVILYKRAQEVRWVPIHHERIHAWWGEAARRRTQLSDAVQSIAIASAAEIARAPNAAPPLQTGAVPPPETQAPVAPQLSGNPSLDELLRYHEWTNQGH